MNDGKPRVVILRRELLRWMGAGTAAALLPGCTGSQGYSYRFLTAAEVAALGALADAILPPDGDPGGKELGTCEYVDRLLSAFDGGGPIWGGGPFSGRAPEPAPDGTASNHFPQDSFATPLPLDRIHRLYWRNLIHGSAVQPGPNDALDGTSPGYRAVIRAGLANAHSQSLRLTGHSLELDAAGAIAVVRNLLADSSNGGAEFIQLVMTFVVQACFAAPEYGGNSAQAGWKIAHWEGDRQPLGYSWYDPATQTYREDPRAPVSTANPHPDADPMDSETQTLVILTAATQA